MQNNNFCNNHCHCLILPPILESCTPWEYFQNVEEKEDKDSIKEPSLSRKRAKYKINRNIQETWHKYFNIAIAFFYSIPEFSEGLKHLEYAEKICDDAECLSETSCNKALGPEVKEDENDCSIPSDFVPPENLKYFVEFDLPVGFLRLRRAFLNKESPFWLETILEGALQYKEVLLSEWDHHDSQIGLSRTPSIVKGEDFIGAKMTANFLMPKTTLIAANVATETTVLSAYNDYCFALKKSTLTPDVPFGNRFVAHTQMVVLNKGKNSCKLICSVQAEFPDGEPMGIGWKIKKGMKSGSMDTFEKIKDKIIAVSNA